MRSRDQRFLNRIVNTVQGAPMNELEHLLLDMIECEVDLDDLEKVEEIMTEAARELGVVIREKVHHQFSPYGLTVIYIIAESHISYHSWPEYRSCFVDVFACSRISTEKGIEVFKKHFKPKHTIIRVLKRDAQL